ncbi:uncharacterized protein LOC143360963 [Halictus rubicundus]|uniref:uncharacterized protein LOC143360963 n=1 Tax=Halictus rubicundus TaxID=77578 RepID=UPI0040357ECA
MDPPTQEKDEMDMDKIYVDLEKLKKQINDFIYTVEGENTEEPKRKKIKTLTTKTKRLLLQHKEIKEELQYYESMYRKALIKNAKRLKREMKRDKLKLNDLKEKCRTQDVHVEVTLMKMKHKEADKTGRPSLTERSIAKGTFFKGTSPTIKDKLKIKMKTSKKPAVRKIFKQKSTRLSDNIKIQIQKNKETGQRELFFFNPNKTKERFSDLVQRKEIKPNNFRECRIMLQKLTEEQTRQYTGEKKSEPRKNPQKSPGSSPQNRKSKSLSAKSNWRIRIPKAVLEESQSEEQNFKLNTSDNATKAKRKRSTDKQN